MRIIAGHYKGKPLIAPHDDAIRPTSERAREALFNLLVHLPDNPVMGGRIVDICCGSGALGLEALSRGALHCHFIDNARSSLQLTQRNIDRLGITGAQSNCLQANASQLPTAREPVDIVLIDPPYRHRTLINSAYESLQAQGWLHEQSVICFEHSAKDTPPELTGCEIIKQRRYGKSAIVIYQCEK